MVLSSGRVTIVSLGLMISVFPGFIGLEGTRMFLVLVFYCQVPSVLMAITLAVSLPPIFFTSVMTLMPLGSILILLLVVGTLVTGRVCLDGRHLCF